MQATVQALLEADRNIVDRCTSEQRVIYDENRSNAQERASAVIQGTNSARMRRGFIPQDYFSVANSSDSFGETQAVGKNSVARTPGFDAHDGFLFRNGKLKSNASVSVTKNFILTAMIASSGQNSSRRVSTLLVRDLLHRLHKP